MTLASCIDMRMSFSGLRQMRILAAAARRSGPLLQVRRRVAAAASCVLASLIGSGAAAAADAGGDCVAVAAAPDEQVEQARRLAAAGRRAAALLLLQRRLALAPQDCAAREALLALLKDLGGDAAAHELPAAADLGGRPWLSRALAAWRPGAWVALEAGHDSNINSATRLGSIDLPLLNYRSLALNPVLVARASGFAGIDAGLVSNRQLSPTASASLIVQASARLNAGESTYLPHGYLGGLAAEKWWAQVRLAGEAVYLQRRLGRFRVIDRWQHGASLGFAPMPGWRLSVQLSAASNRYPLFNAIDTREQSVGLQLGHAGSGLTATAASGHERAIGPQKDLDRDFDSLMLDWSFKRGNGDTLAARIGAGRSRYLAPSPLFLAQRLDKTSELAAWYRHGLGGGWSLTPKLSIEENASTIPVVAFRRRQVLLELRREW